MRTLNALAAVAWADFLERVRRYSFLVTLLAAVYLGYAAATGKVVLSLDNYRGVYTAGWIGLMVALVTSTFVSFIGFYIVKNAIDRDRTTRVGQILGATPLSKTSYVLGKFVSNFAVLGFIVLILSLGAMAMFFLSAEDRRFDVWALFSPFVLIALPAIGLTAAFAVLFETIPFLRGGFGNVFWFFAWGFSLAVPKIVGQSWIDPMGLKTTMDSLMPIARAAIPNYKNGVSLTVGSGQAVIAPGLHYAGFSWTWETVFLRLVWVAVAICITLVAAILFDRFDDTRSLLPAFGTRQSEKAASTFDALRVATPVRVEPVARVHLTPLDRTAGGGGFLRIFRAEVRLGLQGHRWWWYVIAIGLLIGEFVAPLSTSYGLLLPFAWLWPVLVWSGLGARETRFSVRQILFSCANIVPRQFLACWLAGVFIALLTSFGTASRLLLAGQNWNFLAVLAGALFVPSLGLALGVITGSSKFFEGFYTALWYVGPLNHSPGIDFTGAGSGASSLHYTLIYLVVAAVLLVVAFFARSRQLRG